MSLSLFYWDQAEQQQHAADAADLEHVRERCQRASDAWTLLAQRSERGDATRSATAAAEPLPKHRP